MIITKYYVYICILYTDYVHRLYITFFLHIQVSRKVRTKLIVRVNEADEKSLCKIMSENGLLKSYRRSEICIFFEYSCRSSYSNEYI